MSNIQFIDIKKQYKVIEDNIKQAIHRVLEHGQFILGPEVQALEEMLKSSTQAVDVISCSSGTDALQLLLMAKHVGQGDAVFVPAFTFAATAEVVALRQATPVFVDICPETFNIDLRSLERAVEQAKQNGLRPAGIIAVDLFGLPANYPLLAEFAQANKLWLMADAAQSFGGQIDQQKVGTLTDMTAFSFFPSKTLGCYGDGGAVAVQDLEMAKYIRSIRVHGAVKTRFDHHYVGLNSRLDSIQAAVLIEKLKIFEDELKQRHHIAKTYDALLKNHVKTPVIPKGYTSAWALYTVICESAQRDRIEQIFTEKQIPYNVYYKKPLHLQQAYAHFPRAGKNLETAEQLSTQVISLPMHPYLTQADQAYIADLIKSC